MAEGDLIAQDYQVELQAVLMGDGTDYHWTRDEMTVLGLPELRDSQIERPRDHGLLMGRDLFAGRHVVLPFQVVGTDTDDLQSLIDALVAAFAPVDAPVVLVFRLPAGTRRMNGAPKRVMVTPRFLRGAAASVTAEFLATDPRIYDNDLTSVVVSLATSSGGLDWPVEWPLSWGSATSGTETLTNEGNYPTRPTVTFTGPLTSPSVENLTTGEEWSSSFDLQSGDELVVDFDARTVLLNGTASRYSSVDPGSVWWELAPGDNQVRISAGAGSGTATIEFRSAWI